ncbi:hypothetical protein SHPE106448_00795 [Shewanella pealeana]
MANKLLSSIEQAFTLLLFCHSDEAYCIYSCDSLIEGMRAWPIVRVKEHHLLDKQVADATNLNECNQDR